MIEYISAKEAATKWGVTSTWVTVLCSNGRIPGVIKQGKKWLIPEDITELRKLKKKVF